MSPDFAITLVYIGYALAVLLTFGAILTWVERKQAAIMSDDESKRVDFVFTPGQVTLSARGPDTGSSLVTLPLPEYDGPEVAIAFDPHYLIEMLKANEAADTLTLEMTDGSKPAVFRADGYTYLVMPLAG